MLPAIIMGKTRFAQPNFIELFATLALDTSTSQTAIQPAEGPVRGQCSKNALCNSIDVSEAHQPDVLCPHSRRSLIGSTVCAVEKRNLMGYKIDPFHTVRLEVVGTVTKSSGRKRFDFACICPISESEVFSLMNRESDLLESVVSTVVP